MKNENNKYKVLVLPFVFIYVWLLFKTAWVSDDAYITFRSIENFIHGYGLVHNIGERVQTFTHPLWFFVLSGANFLVQQLTTVWAQMYYVSVGISMILSIATILVLVFYVARSSRGAILSLIVLISSKAFVDYSTSGLENSLTHFLFIAYLSVYLWDAESDDKKMILLASIAGLGTLNRLDSLLLFAPPLIHFFWQTENKVKTFVLVVVGFLPVIVWEIFSVFYYGSLVPNTAYAKLNTGIKTLTLLQQGLYYYANSLTLDAVTLSVVAGVIVYVVIKGSSRHILVGTSIVFYLLYILYIGGDFMSGRFFSTPLLAAAALLSLPSYKNKKRYYALIMIIAVLSLLTPTSPLRSPAGYGGPDFRKYIDEQGVADERAVYFHHLGLFNPHRTVDLPGSRFAGHNWISEGEKTVEVVLVKTLGIVGYQAGPNKHVIDHNALADPLMARLPLVDENQWRVGHYRHAIPQGYLETLFSGQNMIKDDGVADYYDKLSFIVRGNLYNWRRLVEIIKFNFGAYDDLIESYLPPENS